jgi:hypothetical protein
VDYRLAEQLCERLQIGLVNLAKPIPISDFAGEVHQAISQALHMPVRVNNHQQESQIFYMTEAAYPMILGKKWTRLHGCIPNPIDSLVQFDRSCVFKEQSTEQQDHRLKSANALRDAQMCQEKPLEEQPPPVTKILKRPETVPVVSEPRRPARVKKIVRSRMAAVANQQRGFREAKAPKYSTKPVDISTFEQLCTVSGAEVFAIMIEDINEHIQKQAAAKPDPEEVCQWNFDNSQTCSQKKHQTLSQSTGKSMTIILSLRMERSCPERSPCVG